MAEEGAIAWEGEKCKYESEEAGESGGTAEEEADVGEDAGGIVWVEQRAS